MLQEAGFDSLEKALIKLNKIFRRLLMEYALELWKRCLVVRNELVSHAAIRASCSHATLHTHVNISARAPHAQNVRKRNGTAVAYTQRCVSFVGIYSC